MKDRQGATANAPDYTPDPHFWDDVIARRDALSALVSMPVHFSVQDHALIISIRDVDQTDPRVLRESRAVVPGYAIMRSDNWLIQGWRDLTRRPPKFAPLPRHERVEIATKCLFHLVKQTQLATGEIGETAVSYLSGGVANAGEEHDET